MPGPGPGVPPGMMGAPGSPAAGIPATESPEQKMQRKMELIASAIALLRQDKIRGFRIDIETDSTVQGDAMQEKAQRIEFVEGVTKFIEAAGQVSATLPEFTPLAAKMLGFAVRGFRVGRDLESAIEDFCDSVEQKAKEQAANPQQKASPEQIKADSERYKADKEVERQKIENEGEAHNNMIDLESKKLDIRMKEMELEMKRIELQMKTGLAHASLIEKMTPEAGAEGEGESKPDPMHGVIHPHLALKQISEAAQVFDLASKRNAAPKRIVRGPDGKATHVVTEFQEQ